MHWQVCKTPLFSSQHSHNQTESSGKRQDIEVLNPPNSLHTPNGAVNDRGKQEEREPSFGQSKMHFEGGPARSNPLSRAIICGSIGNNFREAFNRSITHGYYLRCA